MRKDQALDVVLPITEEHVLGPQETDALSAHTTCPSSVWRGVGIGADQHSPTAVCVAHDAVHRLDEIAGALIHPVKGRGHPFLEVLHDGAIHDRHRTPIDDTTGAVNGDHLTLTNHRAIRRGHLAP